MYNIENFKNEISYDLSMEEAGKVILKYQDVVIRTILEGKLNKTDKKELLDLYGSIRSGRFMDGLEYLLNMDNQKVDTDLAYVLMAAIDHDYVDYKAKNRAADLAYRLRMPIYREKIGDEFLAQIVAGLSFWNIQGFETTSEFRINAMIQTIKRFPRLLTLAFTDSENKHKIVNVSNRLLLLMLKAVSPDIKPSELAAAFIGAEFPDINDMDEADKMYAYKIRSLGYEVCSLVTKENLMRILEAECIRKDDYNKRFDKNIKIGDSFIDPSFISMVVNDAKENGKVDETIETLDKINKVFIEFIGTHKEFEYLF